MNCTICGGSNYSLGVRCPFCAGDQTGIANHLAAQQNMNALGILPGGTGQPGIDAMARDAYARGRQFEREHILAKLDAIDTSLDPIGVVSAFRDLIEELKR